MTIKQSAARPIWYCYLVNSSSQNAVTKLPELNHNKTKSEISNNLDYGLPQRYCLYK